MLTLARRIARLLKAGDLKVVFAESCTGGLVSGALTKIPGISAHHCGGVVVYRNETKQAYLNIPAAMLDDPGAVSHEVAELLALRVLAKTPEADIAASVTGHLGPNAPPALDGLVFAGIARRQPGRQKPTVVVEKFRCRRTESRTARQRWVVGRVLEFLGRATPSRKIVMTTESSTTEQRQTHGSSQNRRATAIVAIVALYLAISALTMQTVESLIAYDWGISQHPSPLIGLLQAWCSLSAIWWVHSRWTSHVKTLHAVLACLVIWGVLVLEGEHTEFTSAHGACWLASLMTQFLGTAVGTLLVGFVFRGRSEIRIHRFSIMYLVIWTLVVAVLLGAGRWLIESFGWTWEVVRWQYFPHLLIVGVIGAAQAVAVAGVLQLPWQWWARSIVLGSIPLATMALASAVFFYGFRDAGADVFEICRQFGLQALFLLATLVPLRISGDYCCRANSATTG